MINQTNDAWFEKSSASRQHMAHCVLRCVENQVPALRAANTGISCYIDSHGIIRDVLQSAEGDTFIANTLKVWVLVPQADMPLTFYTRHGDLFAWSCLIGTGLLLATFGRHPSHAPEEGHSGEVNTSKE